MAPMGAISTEYHSFVMFLCVERYHHKACKEGCRILQGKSFDNFCNEYNWFHKIGFIK